MGSRSDTERGSLTRWCRSEGGDERLPDILEAIGDLERYAVRGREARWGDEGDDRPDTPFTPQYPAL
ncbi:hypothetical protein BN140_0389 [Methanoculleus bourgensis MS2]|uniref:Uncharacterized protein n=1 Tax=Methanoculleus bourgensis (strain ATCC 43281 / DSM 3045 / OCM 15 / MS2) TaxID=1201294 RepID=I7LIU3_METBM|nr:hypothetical protein BN140_0389 [Methanoculleus bourgensis MS2]